MKTKTKPKKFKPVFQVGPLYGDLYYYPKKGVCRIFCLGNWHKCRNIEYFSSDCTITRANARRLFPKAFEKLPE